MSESNDTPHQRDPHARGRQEFLLASVVSILGAIIGIASSFLEFRWDSNTAVQSVRQVHWMIWVCFVPALYAVGCYVNEKTRNARGILRVPLWTQLRGFGDQRVSRISYWALVLIPMITYLVSRNPLQLTMPEISIPISMKLAFFASWFFSIALILFSVGCPREFRQQNPLENARTVNLVMSDVTESRVIIEPPRVIDDPHLDQTALELRAASFLFYVLGLTVSVVILLRSAWFVVTV